MIVAATPIDPPEGDRCWAFHIINDDDEAIDELVVVRVHYTWGDFGNSEEIGARFAAIAAGTSREIYRETDTEMRTGLELHILTATGSWSLIAEVGKLYATPRGLVDIPELGRRGLVAELEPILAAT